MGSLTNVVPVCVTFSVRGVRRPAPLTVTVTGAGPLREVIVPRTTARGLIGAPLLGESIESVVGASEIVKVVRAAGLALLARSKARAVTT
jgi:hypothetical protein